MMMLKIEVKSGHFSIKNLLKTSHLTQKRIQTETPHNLTPGYFLHLISYLILPITLLFSQRPSCSYTSNWLLPMALVLTFPLPEVSRSPQSWLLHSDPTMSSDHRGLLLLYVLYLLLPWFVFCLSNYNCFSKYILPITLIPISKYQIVNSLSIQTLFCLLL